MLVRIFFFNMHLFPRCPRICTFFISPESRNLLTTMSSRTFNFLVSTMSSYPLQYVLEKIVLVSTIPSYPLLYVLETMGVSYESYPLCLGINTHSTVSTFSVCPRIYNLLYPRIHGVLVSTLSQCPRIHTSTVSSLKYKRFNHCILYMRYGFQFFTFLYNY